MNDQYVLFDVGANFGHDSLEIVEANPHYVAYAFEPTPELAAKLRESSAKFADRYHVHEIAVSDHDGYADFNVASHADWGVSSLNAFSDNLGETWPRRNDLYHDRKERVRVTRLDTWFRQAKPAISQIDFFHCDTQGSDLRVLRGLGDYFGMIREGVIEVPSSAEVMLYKGQHTKEEALDFLADRGYEVFRVVAQQNEENLFFRPIR